MEHLLKIAGELKNLSDDDKRKFAAVIAGSILQRIDTTKPIDRLELEIAIFASLQ